MEYVNHKRKQTLYIGEQRAANGNSEITERQSIRSIDLRYQLLCANDNNTSSPAICLPDCVEYSHGNGWRWVANVHCQNGNDVRGVVLKSHAKTAL